MNIVCTCIDISLKNNNAFIVYLFKGTFFFRLFVTPLRCGIFTDLSLTLRRRLNDRDFNLFNNEEECSYISEDDEIHKADDVVPQIYACATMWHETRNEMIQLLKSIFRFVYN